MFGWNVICGDDVEFACCDELAYDLCENDDDWFEKDDDGFDDDGGYVLVDGIVFSNDVSVMDDVFGDRFVDDDDN